METNETNVNVNETGAEQEEKLTFTQAELDALIQSKSDARVSLALKTQERKQREAEKLRGMSAEDKREYDLSEREAAIAAKELELARAENKAECLSILADKGLDTKLVDLVLSEDADAMYNNIKLLEKAFKASVKDEVEKRLGSASPKKNLAPEDGMTTEIFNKMSLADQQAFADANPALMKSLFN